MRTETEMLDLILGIAREDDRIRAVYMNGSRANPSAPRDIFQDYDMVYIVTETGSFLQDRSWIKRFGDLMIMQLPDEQDQLLGQEIHVDRHYTYLMQFADGNRIDLTVKTADDGFEAYQAEKMTIPLLDKDRILPPIPAPADEDFWVKKPTQALFDRCCNEFWWVSLYVGKGLWRGELLYAMDIMNHYLRPELLEMLSWHGGILTDFSASMGKNCKYLNQYLPEDWWRRLLRTYPRASSDAIWIALQITCRLFDDSTRSVGRSLGLTCRTDEGENCRAYLQHIRHLPRGAREII